jgi:hypothetical protein
MICNSIFGCTIAQSLCHIPPHLTLRKFYCPNLLEERF